MKHNVITRSSHDIVKEITSDTTEVLNAVNKPLSDVQTKEKTKIHSNWTQGMNTATGMSVR